MINSLEVYFEVGVKTGKAAKVQDWSLAKFHQAWLTKAYALETPDDRLLAAAEFKRGYQQGRCIVASK